MRGGKPHTKIKIFNSKEKKKMANITINTKNGTIELAKGFAKAASRYGTKEYAQLQEVRRDYPGYTVRDVSIKKKEKSGKNPLEGFDIFKGLTYDYMEKYISKHDEGGKIMSEYKLLRGKTEEAEEMLAESCSYKEIREWFLKKFPEIKKFHEERAKILCA